MNVWIIEDDHYDLQAVAESEEAAEKWVRMQLAQEAEGEPVTKKEVQEAMDFRYRIYVREVFKL